MRLKELANKVLSADSLAKGYSFSRTFRLLYNGYDLDREEAFYIAMHAHRGGGFTKDYLCLIGQNIYNYYAAGTDLGILLTGKVSLEFVNEIEYMINHKYVITPKHITDSHSENKNTNKTVDFILHNLK